MKPLKPLLILCTLLAILAVTTAATNSGIQSLDRKASHVRIDGNGEIRIEPRTGQSVTFTVGTKNARLDLTNIADAATRTINIPNANSTTVQANTGAASNFLTAISAQGVVSRAQPAFTDISGTATAAQIPTALNSVTFATGKTVALTDADSLTVNSVIVPQTGIVNWTAIGAANVSGDFVFIAHRALQVTTIRIAQRAQGGSGCVIDVEKLTSTTAPGSGTVLGTGSYNCNSTANNTVTTYTLTGTVGTLQLAAGDRLGVKLGGTLTSLAGATVTVQFKAI
jgi:hypothetical protein